MNSAEFKKIQVTLVCLFPFVFADETQEQQQKLKQKLIHPADQDSDSPSRELAQTALQLQE